MVCEALRRAELETQSALKALETYCFRPVFGRSTCICQLMHINFIKGYLAALENDEIKAS
jgi:hypothetical protein